MTKISDVPALRAVGAPVVGGDRQIGAILVDSGKISLEDAERILRVQKEKGIRFGEAAIRLGLISEPDLHWVLAEQYDYPYITTQESRLSRELIAAYQPFSPQVEMLRAIRSQLMLRWFDKQRNRLAVISPSSGEGRSNLAANLAVVFSQLGERTLLIDADMRNPKQHSLFGLDTQGGLSAFLSGRSQEPKLNRIANLLDLTVLTAGPPPPNPQELLSRPNFSKTLAELAEEFDVVLIDTPAADSSADAQTLAVHACGALLLARQDRTRLKSLTALHTSVVSTGGQIVGSVLTRF